MPYSRFFDFSGGVNDTASLVKTMPNEMDQAVNVDLARDGAVTKRKGAQKQNSVTTGASDEFGMVFQFRPTAGTAKLLTAYADEIAEWGGSSFTSLITGLTSNQVVLPVAFKNLCYFNNNSDVPLVYYPDKAGTPRIFRAGTPAPTSSPTQGADVAGSLTPSATILVRIRYVSVIDGTFFGEPYPAAGVSITIGGSGGRTIDNIPTYTPSGIDHVVVDRIVERTEEGPGGTFFEDGRLGDNTTTTYDITQSDADLVAGGNIMPDLETRLIPPTLYPFVAYKNRIVGYDASEFGKVVWSEIDEFGILPEAFPNLNFAFLDVQDFRDQPVAAAVLGEYVVWYCGRSIHVLFIDGNGDAFTRRIAGHDLGVPSARAVVELPNGHVIWTYRGPYLFDGQNMVYIGERIEGTLASLPKTDFDKMYAVHLPQEQRRQIKFVMPKDSGSNNNFAAVYHYRRPVLNPTGFPTEHAWTFKDGFEAKSGAVVEELSGELIEYSGSYDGFLYREDIGDQDQHDGSNLIDGYFRTVWLDMGEPDMVKNFSDVWVILEATGSETIVLTWETEFENGLSGSVNLTSGAVGSLFGTAVFGTARFSGTDVTIAHSFLANDGVTAVGKWLRLRFSNSNADAPFNVIGFVVKWQEMRDRNDSID